MTEQPSSRPLTPLHILLPVQGALLAGGVLAGLFLVDFGHSLVGGLWGLAWGLALMIAGIVKRRGTLVFTGIIALLMGPLSAWGLHETLRMGRGQVAWDVAVEKAASQEQAQLFYFRKARVLPSYQHHLVVTATWRGLDTLHHYYVAPLVGPGWQKGQAVVVWAACRDVDCQRFWKHSKGVGVREPDVADGFAKAIGEACQRHGLTSAPTPVIIRWVDDPRAQARIYRVMTWSLVVFFSLVWLVGILLGRRSARKAKAS